jgi:hypothetical protein
VFEFTIVPDDKGREPFKVSAGLRDLRVWEKTHKGRSLGQVSSAAGVSATLMFEIAYAACVRQRLLPPGTTEEQFVDEFELEVGDTPATKDDGPAPPALPDGDGQPEAVDPTR